MIIIYGLQDIILVQVSRRTISSVQSAMASASLLATGNMLMVLNPAAVVVLVVAAGGGGGLVVVVVVVVVVVIVVVVVVVVVVILCSHSEGDALQQISGVEATSSSHRNFQRSCSLLESLPVQSPLCGGSPLHPRAKRRQITALDQALTVYIWEFPKIGDPNLNPKP